jgi:hypothetical protein
MRFAQSPHRRQSNFNRGAAMNPSIKSVLYRITVLVVVTLAVAAVFDWSGLSH